MKLALSILLCGALAASAQTLNVSGTANVGAVTQYMLDTNAALLWVSTNWLNFGTNLTNITNDVSFTVSNAGTATLVGGVTNNAPFSWVGMSNYTLAPNGSSNLTIRYTRGSSATTDTNQLGLTGGGGTNVHLSGVVTNAPGVGTFYFGSSGTNSASLIGYFGTSLLVGDAVTVTTGGTIKKIGAKLENTYAAATNMAIALWTNSGSAWVLHECVEFSLAASWGPAWTNVTLASPVIVGNGTAVRVQYICEQTGLNVGWYGGSEASGGYREARTWANRCSATEPAWTDDEHAGACVYVE